MPTGIYKRDYNKIYTKERNRKISGTLMGHFVSEETRKAISEAHKGKKVSEKTREKMSNAHEGEKAYNWKGENVKMICQKCNKEFEVRPSLINIRKFCSMGCYGNYQRTLKGELSLRWKGENCKKRQKRNDSLYQWWVRQCKKRDKNTCRINKDCSGYCIVHHILPWRDYPELRYEINNGITLCQAHHPRKRAEEKRLIPFFRGLVPVLNEPF